MNPFAPPETTSVGGFHRQLYSQAEASIKKRSPVVSLATWSFVCIVSAAPSFAWGLGTIASDQILAMCTGIATFILLYTCGDLCSQTQKWRQNHQVSMTLKIGYITRIMITVIFPIGAGLDVICGLFSVGVVQAAFPQLIKHAGDAADMDGKAGFLGTLLVTLTQGIILNVVLFSFMLLVFGVVVATTRLWTKPKFVIDELNSEQNFSS